ncbi:hypothetical protein GPA27_19430 [Aromatoleum toluolicum]|uniref:Peptidase M41 domain-containing protein n=1 Tax=Aromatoleum toluolicum TaxID=90060 RepID=A0ABX1NJQ8_9RHOO|nr:hypothetical protein [Aromatoleum toluolicum]NMF99553.1 hypothetical protein [Aromatoleum toluolicum]
MKPKASRVVAIHEAGHCLAHWWNGQSIHRVIVRPSSVREPVIDRRGREVRCQGLTEASSFISSPAFIPLLPPRPDLLEDVERDLLHAYAGPVAESRQNHGSLVVVLLTSAGAGDSQHADELLALLPEDQRRGASARALARSRSLVGRYWRALSAVADLLQEKGDVEGDEIMSLFAAVTGETQRWKGNPLASIPMRAAA